MAWEVYRRTLEWEEVQRAPLEESTVERRPPASSPAPPAPAAPSAAPLAPESESLSQNKISRLRNNSVQRKCTNLSHMLTLRSQGTKVGFSTVCGECAQEISWEDLNRDGRAVR